MNVYDLILASQGVNLMPHKRDPQLVAISGGRWNTSGRAGTRTLRTIEEQRGHDPELTEAG
jgi:hypothetical protein